MNSNHNSPNHSPKNPKQKARWAQKATGFLDRHGFYVVLALCLIIIAVTAIATMGGPEAMPEQTNTEVQYVEGGGLEDQLKSPSDQAAVTPSPTPTPTPTPKPTVAPVAPKASLIRPVEGEVSVLFAQKTLIYNKTLRQWMTHNGIDIAAKEGAEVKAVAGGTVEKVEENALLGNTVTILHEDGNRSVYASMTDIKVKADQKVKQGDTLGKAGNTAIAEYDEGVHLHFEYIVDGKHVDPLDYISGYKIKEQDNAASPGKTDNTAAPSETGKTGE